MTSRIKWEQRGDVEDEDDNTPCSIVWEGVVIDRAFSDWKVCVCVCVICPTLLAVQSRPTLQVSSIIIVNFDLGLSVHCTCTMYLSCVDSLFHH